MAVEIEKLEGLERKLILSLPWQEIKKEVSQKLKDTQKRVRFDGFRPGKAPFKMVENMYGQSVQEDVLNNKAFKTFYDIVDQENLKVAGLKKFEALPANKSNDEIIQIVAIFELMPEDIQPVDFTGKQIEKIVTQISEQDVDKTIEVLRKQRIKYQHVDRAAELTDRVIVDFEGKVDGVVFEGGVAKNYPIILGEGQMLPEFETGILGLKEGETKEVEVNFPENYHGEAVAGKKAVFMITVRSIAKGILPELDETFAKALGVSDGDVAKLREEIKVNLSREVGRRVDLKNKEVIMNLLLESSDFLIPSILIEREVKRLREKAEENFLTQGMSKENLPQLPDEMFQDKAKRSVKIGLILNQLIEKESLQATEEQIKAVIEDIAQNYENPEEVLRYYLNNKEEYLNAQSLATENNVVAYVFAKVSTTDVEKSFDELM